MTIEKLNGKFNRCCVFFFWRLILYKNGFHHAMFARTFYGFLQKKKKKNVLYMDVFRWNIRQPNGQIFFLLKCFGTRVNGIEGFEMSLSRSLFAHWGIFKYHIHYYCHWAYMSPSTRPSGWKYRYSYSFVLKYMLLIDFRCVIQCLQAYYKK